MPPEEPRTARQEVSSLALGRSKTSSGVPAISAVTAVTRLRQTAFSSAAGFTARLIILERAPRLRRRPFRAHDARTHAEDHRAPARRALLSSLKPSGPMNS